MFQFTHPVRGATKPSKPFLALPPVSIHAPRAGCDSTRWSGHSVATVSIHAPRAGCDATERELLRYTNVSIHAPRAGCDRQRSTQSTCTTSFNSRTPCGVRQWANRTLGSRKRVSIHAPRVGCDPICYETFRRYMFQFTHPVWGATSDLASDANLTVVSIHAPRVGCDYSVW